MCNDPESTFQERVLEDELRSTLLAVEISCCEELGSLQLNVKELVELSLLQSILLNS